MRGRLGRRSSDLHNGWSVNAARADFFFFLAEDDTCSTTPVVMSTDPQLSDVQLQFMRVLWDLGEATAADVHAELSRRDRELAPTTVSTVLARLEKRGLVRHRSEGRQYVYRAVVTEQDVRGSMVERLADNFFGGDVTRLVSHLLDAREIHPDDLAEVKRLIARKEQHSEE